MSRVCFFTGKRTVAGRSIARRGKAKYLGGVGRKVTGITRRKFKPNIQKVRAVVDGKVCRIKVSAKAIRMGLVQKPTKRNYKSAQEHKSISAQGTRFGTGRRSNKDRTASLAQIGVNLQHRCYRVFRHSLVLSPAY